MLPVVRAMAKLGATDIEVARALGISLSLIGLWCRTHPKFLAAIKPPKKVADERVVQSMFKRATGYTFDSEEIVPYDHVTQHFDQKGHLTKTVKVKKVLRVPIVKEVAPSDTAGIFWLKNRRRNEWRDYKATELTTPPGQPLELKSAPGEAELVGAYFARLARQAGTEPPTPTPGGPPGADPAPDPGVGERGQGPHRQSGDPKARQG